MANIKLTKEQQQYIVLAVMVIGGGGFGYLKYFWMPTSQKIEDTEKKIVEVEGKINKAKGKAGKLKKIQRDLEKLNAQAEEAEKRLPKSQDLPSVIDTISSLSRGQNVEITNFQPQGDVKKPHFIETPYKITATASYHDIGQFFAAIALEERIYNIRDISFSGGKGDKLSITFDLISYQYKG